MGHRVVSPLPWCSPQCALFEIHIVKVKEFILAPHQCTVPTGAFYASFDVVPIYTNVNNAEAVQSVLFHQE